MMNSLKDLWRVQLNISEVKLSGLCISRSPLKFKNGDDMADVRPFCAVRPAEGLADRIAALPYDVYSRKEAKEKVKDDKYSFLRIDRPETQFPDSQDMYAPEVYEKGAEIYRDMKDRGEFLKDKENSYYIYELIMDGRHQTGIVAACSCDDYLNGRIKRHENTRAEKEKDRIEHVYTLSAQTGPIFLAYRDSDTINQIVSEEKKNAPIYSFTADDGIIHNAWRIDDPEKIDLLKQAFNIVDSVYIADGHHRAASAVKVALRKRDENPGYETDEEFNFFLSVLFPESQLQILPYNRVVKDICGMEISEFLDKIKECFDIEKAAGRVSPNEICTFGMYLDGQWYLLKAKDEIRSSDPVKGLDASILQDHLLGPVLGIEDPRTDSRIDFVGGIRGLGELERRCDIESGDMRLAFSMYPTSMSELFAVADAGLLMPPKSTWFEPKLRSGLFIHEF